MGDTNYLATVVKILEKPRKTDINDKLVTTKFRAQLAQVRNSRIVNLVFWGNLARDVANYYQMNDYILVEGYSSIKLKKNIKVVTINVYKCYTLNC